MSLSTKLLAAAALPATVSTIWTAPALAQSSLPAAYLDQYYNAPDAQVDWSTDGRLKGAGANYSVTTMIDTAFGGTVLSSVDSTGVNVSMGASLGYYVEVVNPDPLNIPESYVPLNLTAHGAVQVWTPDPTTGPSLTSTAELFAFGAMQVSIGVGLNGRPYVTDSFDFSQDFQVLTDQPYYVGITAYGGYNSGSTEGYAEQMVDPTFTIAPGYSQYHLAFSPGVTSGPALPPSAVPEPSTWALMLLGIGLAGVVARRSTARARESLGAAADEALASV